MSTTKKYYFFKTVFEKNRPRMRPLSNQNLEGETINTDWNLSCNQEIRSEYPMGTVFCTDTMTKANGFYQGGEVYVLGQPAAPEGVRATLEMHRAYDELTGKATAEPAKAKPHVETFLMKLMKNPKYKAPDIMDGFYVPEEKWFLIIRNLKNSINTILTGPTGTGKTELIQLVCKQLGVPCHIFDMGAMIDPIAGLLGVHRLHEGSSIFDYAKFTKVLDKPGVSVLDELSRAPASSNNILFPTLDSRRCLPVEIACGDEDRNIDLHVDHCLVATANIGGEYTGTNQLDAALKNRFFQVELEYMPPELEIKVLTTRANIETSEAMIVAKVAESVRKAYLNNDIPESISTRETIAIAQLIRDGFKPIDALELGLLPKFMHEDRAVVKAILASR